MVAPELAVPGKTTAVLVTLHGPAGSQPLNVSLKLLPDKKADGIEEPQHVLETVQEVKGKLRTIVRFCCSSNERAMSLRKIK